MDDFTNALSALGVAAPAAVPRVEVRGTNTSGYANEAQMRQTSGGDIGADPQAAIREINATQKQMAAAPNLDPASRQMLADHIAEMHRQLSNIPLGTGSSTPAQTQTAQAPADDDFSGAIAALNAPAQPAQRPTAQQVEQMAQPLAKPGAPADPHAPISSPAFDLTANQVTGLGSTVAGGVAGIGKGLYTLAKTGSVEQAVDAGAETSKAIQQAGTYQPRTEQGARMVEQFGSNYNPLSWIPNATQAVGDRAGAALESNGMPAAGALVKGAGAAAPLALGLGAKSLSGMLKGGADVAEVPRVDPTMSPTPPVKPRYKMVNGQPVLIEEGAPPQTVTQPITPPGQAPAAVPAGAPAGAGAAPAVAPKPTLAQATPELRQAVAEAQKQGVDVHPDVLARHVEADTLPVPVKLTTGQAAQSPVLISNEMNSRGKGQGAPVPADFYNDQAKALASNLDVMRSQSAPDVTASHPAEHGQTLIDQYKAADAPIRADITAKYKALADANGGNLPMSGEDFVNAADVAMKKGDVGEWLPDKVQAKLESYRNGAPMSYDNFENMRTILANEARKAGSGPSPDGNAVHAIGVVRDALESLPMSGEAANLKPLADAARGAAKARFDALKADPAYKAAINDGAAQGDPSRLADKFVQNYLINGKGADVKQMRANLGGSDLANQTIAAAGLDYLKGMSKADAKTGVFASDSFNRGLKQLGPKANDIFGPQTAQNLQQVGNVAKYTSAAPRGSFVNSSNSTTALGSPAMQAAVTSAKTLAEHGTNMAFGGIPVGTGVRKLSQIVGASKEAKAAAADSKASVEPLAGFKKLSDLPGGR